MSLLRRSLLILALLGPMAVMLLAEASYQEPIGTSQRQFRPRAKGRQKMRLPGNRGEDGETHLLLRRASSSSSSDGERRSLTSALALVAATWLAPPPVSPVVREPVASRSAHLSAVLYLLNCSLLI